MTQYDPHYVKPWLARSMQSYVYFAGSDWIDGSRERVHEQVRQKKLKDIMKIHKPSNFVIEANPPYKKISPVDLQSEAWLGDLAVREIVRHEQRRRTFRTQYLFELKIFDAPVRKIDFDLHKLASLRRAKQARGKPCRAFLVVLGIGVPPKRFANLGHEKKLVRESMPDVDIVYKTRGIFTAAPIGREDDAHYACLVEVISESEE